MTVQADASMQPLVREGNVFRGTHRHSGRRVFITPENSSMRHLCYARIRLDGSISEVNFNTGDKETALICLSGQAEIEAGHEKFTLGKHDAAYIPKGCAVRVRGESADLAEFSAEVEGSYPLQRVLDATEVFITSSLRELASVASFDFKHYDLPKARVTRNLSREFQKLFGNDRILR